MKLISSSALALISASSIAGVPSINPCVNITGKYHCTQSNGKSFTVHYTQTAVSLTSFDGIKTDSQKFNVKEELSFEKMGVPPEVAKLFGITSPPTILVTCDAVKILTVGTMGDKDLFRMTIGKKPDGGLHIDVSGEQADASTGDCTKL